MKEGTNAEVDAKWGFLKNIINSDAFFSKGAHGPGCGAECREKERKEAEAKAKKEKEEREAKLKKLKAIEK